MNLARLAHVFIVFHIAMISLVYFSRSLSRIFSTNTLPVASIKAAQDRENAPYANNNAKYHSSVPKKTRNKKSLYLRQAGASPKMSFRNSRKSSRVSSHNVQFSTRESNVRTHRLIWDLCFSSGSSIGLT